MVYLKLSFDLKDVHGKTHKALVVQNVTVKNGVYFMNMLHAWEMVAELADACNLEMGDIGGDDATPFQPYGRIT